MKTYLVRYYAEAPGLPIKTITVHAASVQEARDEAKRLDERYLATAETPRERRVQ